MYGDEHKGKSLSAAAEVEDVNDVGALILLSVLG